MRYLIVDVEATCWEEAISRSQTEIIEIGAVMVASESGPVVDEFAAFVRPILNPELSDFCRELTSIAQSQVDGADFFPHVLDQFLAWAGSAPFIFCSWGDYDQQQFQRDCQLHEIDFPASLAQHINLKAVFAKQQKIRACGMKRALSRMKMPLEGQGHGHGFVQAELSGFQNLTALSAQRGLHGRNDDQRQGQHHRGIDDARNIAQLAIQHILPNLAKNEAR